MWHPFTFVVVCLAAFRITRFVTTDDWPPIQRLRNRLLERWSGTGWDVGLECPWCIGFWVSAALTFALAQLLSIPLPALYALAVSSVVGFIGSRD